MIRAALEIQTPLTPEILRSLKAGDAVRLSGTVYTARDAAHRRLVRMIMEGEPLPFPPAGQVIYYTGPCPAKPGGIIGPAGPTTSARMDPYTPILLAHGIAGMIGKGARSLAVVDAIREAGAVYLAAIGGAAALLAGCVLSQEVIAFEDLGTEAIRKLEVKDMPLFVAIDSRGNDMYEKGRQAYRR